MKMIVLQLSISKIGIEKIEWENSGGGKKRSVKEKEEVNEDDRKIRIDHHFAVGGRNDPLDSLQIALRNI